MKKWSFISALLLLLCSCAAPPQRIALEKKKLPAKDYSKVEYLVRWESLEVVPAERTEAARKLLESQFIAMTRAANADLREVTIPSGKLFDKKSSESFGVKGKCIVYDAAMDELEKDSRYGKSGLLAKRLTYDNAEMTLDIQDGTVLLFRDKAFSGGDNNGIISAGSAVIREGM